MVNRKSHALSCLLVVAALWVFSGCGKTVDLASDRASKDPGVEPKPQLSPIPAVCPEESQINFRYVQSNPVAKEIWIGSDFVGLIQKVLIDGIEVPFSYNASWNVVVLAEEHAGVPGSSIRLVACEGDFGSWRPKPKPKAADFIRES